jgi:aminomethyltransferase
MESETSSILARTLLYSLIVEQKARMTPFSGWEMPVQFTGIVDEHQAIRQRVGMFDISHMGKFAVRGDNLVKTFQGLVPSDLSRLQPGQAQYTVLLNHQAGIIDDIIFYSQGEDEGIIIVNASTKDKDLNWILEKIAGSGVEVTDLSSDRLLIAIQGPQAVSQLQKLVDIDLAPIPAFGHATATIFGQPAFIARTGYTGEDGFEVMVEPEVGIELWRSLIVAGVSPCGLGARDTLRLEAAMALYGQDIDDTTTPLEAGLGWLVHLDTKGNFIGKDILEKQKSEGVTKRLVGLEMTGRNIARHGYPVVFAGKAVGEITSGTMSPTLGKAIALAYVPTSLSKIGQELEVEIRGKNYPAKVVKKPFYRSPNR